MAPALRINAVAYISPQNQPILIRTFNEKNEEAVKYHYIAHTSLDVIEERMAPEIKNTECYLGLLYTMEDVAVYGYVTPLRVKIVVAFALSDSVVRDIEVNTIFKALHMAYYSAISNPFLKLDSATEPLSEKSVFLLAGSPRWKNFRKRVDEVCRAVSNPAPLASIA
ncbi:Sedlin, N-terminal conserved region-domain-containing protein [Schizophyllum amplum]|uniref:Trafficking protein particle complex subunit 2-like protein n=1 Tax=Schizophyllum amplum TaxID=97359 RepID=A0A550CS42_9AGAR|nr:Sedlin, N-terminal conserved region-domain-containing protein [Auriculariopsis ampla]